jgi:geranylgeranyl pyrophosphate synthase
MSHIRSDGVDIKAALLEKSCLVNTVISELIADQVEIEAELKKAIEYMLSAPGKRVRAAIVLWCCELIAGEINNDAKTAAAALEMVHTYSLIHDDLPAMDDDDLRRGQPSCHKAFTEATAILTGDALLTMAFELLATKISDAGTAVRLIRTLAEAAGPSGMIAGQMADLAGENSKGTVEQLQYIHTNKTAKMFAGAAAMGAICGGANDKQIEHLIRFGLKTGLGFQVADDILDVCSMSEKLGKTIGKDVEQGKVTYPSVVGMEESRRIAGQLASQAAGTLDSFGVRANTLRQLAMELSERTR